MLVTDADWRVLRALDDEWVLIGQIHVAMPRAELLGRLRSLRSRGLVTYRRQTEAARDNAASRGEWALSAEGDRITWDVCE